MPYRWLAEVPAIRSVRVSERTLARLTARRCQSATVPPSQRRLVLTICHVMRSYKAQVMSFRFALPLTALFIAAALAACSSGDKPVSAVTSGASGEAAGPIALAPARGAPQTIAMAVDQDALTKAIERLRITKKKKGDSPFDQAGADLNSNGRAKALVLFTGPEWCSPQGCTLVVFEPSDVGFKPI